MWVSNESWRIHLQELLDYRFQVIGHPIMIGDVLDWIGKDKITSLNMYLNFIDERKEKREPIDAQSDKVISFIYSLIVENGNRNVTD